MSSSATHSKLVFSLTLAEPAAKQEKKSPSSLELMQKNRRFWIFMVTILILFVGASSLFMFGETYIGMT